MQRAQNQTYKGFQFTRPRGARLQRSKFDRSCGLVSIHAPTGGATYTTGCSHLASGFQFTRPRGARRAAAEGKAVAQCFNSRAHGGRDSPHTPPESAAPSFNSRAHGGRDQVQSGRDYSLPVSIHAPTGGAT